MNLNFSPGLQVTPMPLLPFLGYLYPLHPAFLAGGWPNFPGAEDEGLALRGMFSPPHPEMSRNMPGRRGVLVRPRQSAVPLLTDLLYPRDGADRQWEGQAGLRDMDSLRMWLWISGCRSEREELLLLSVLVRPLLPAGSSLGLWPLLQLLAGVPQPLFLRTYLRLGGFPPWLIPITYHERIATELLWLLKRRGRKRGRDCLPRPAGSLQPLS